MEETVSASNTIFWIDIHVNGVKSFKSKRNVVNGSFFGSEIYSKSFVLNKSVLKEKYIYLPRFNRLGAWVFTRILAHVIAVLAYSAVI